ncbi:glutaminase (plasmid) [Arthrobacter sp. ZXY-2]|uniref:glutaminase n=1 Tax=Paenarthrobacter ureafaciens TaxID=37931 RepID=UPI0008A69433|nr:glutaminase [Arthrobacter sp. ZXY-2]
MNIQYLLDDLVADIKATPPEGNVADYIPGLETVDPDQFGIAVAMNSGETYSAGNSSTEFSIQSISKVFTLALTIAKDEDDLWTRVSREPSGTPFNSLVQLEHEHGIPRNPFINSGALVVTDRLLTLTGDSHACLQTFLREQSSNPSIEVNEAIAASESLTGHRNASLAYFLTSYQNLVNPVPEVLNAYFRQCAIAMSCEDLARGGSFLSRGGIGANGRVLTADQVRRLNAVMLTCGTYDAAGDFAYRVGLPCKSGVGGGILAVAPGTCTIAVWGPRLGKSGNSAAGVTALAKLTERTGWSVF